MWSNIQNRPNLFYSSFTVSDNLIDRSICRKFTSIPDAKKPFNLIPSITPGKFPISGSSMGPVVREPWQVQVRSTWCTYASMYVAVALVHRSSHETVVRRFCMSKRSYEIHLDDTFNNEPGLRRSPGRVRRWKGARHISQFLPQRSTAPLIRQNLLSANTNSVLSLVFGQKYLWKFLNLSGFEPSKCAYLILRVHMYVRVYCVGLFYVRTLQNVYYNINFSLMS